MVFVLPLVSLADSLVPPTHPILARVGREVDTMLNWQVDQLGCECLIHRYHVAHLCECGKVISHSQASWDAHKFHGEMLNFDPKWYKHGDSYRSVFDRVHTLGQLDYFSEAFRVIWDKLAEQEV